MFGETKIVIKCPSNAMTKCHAVYGVTVGLLFNIKDGEEVFLKPGETFVDKVSYTPQFMVCNPHPTQELEAYGQ